MGKTAITLSRSDRPKVLRKKREQVARLTLYKDGIAKLSRTAYVILGETDAVGLFHDTDDPNVIYVSVRGEHLHKVTTQGSFSAAPLHKHAGSPTQPMRIALTVDEDGDLRGDLSEATWGENRPRRATLATSEVVATASDLGGSVDGDAATSLSIEAVHPDASAPSDTSEDEEYEYEYVEDNAEYESV